MLDIFGFFSFLQWDDVVIFMSVALSGEGLFFLSSNLAKQPSVDTAPEQFRGLEVVPLQQQ